MFPAALKQWRYMVGLLTIFLVVSALVAQQPPGGDSYIFPPGGKAGTSIDVHLGGADWTPDTQFLIHHPDVGLEVFSKPGPVLLPEPPFWFGIKSFANDPRLPREVYARITLPAGIPSGVIHWSVANANGAGSGGVFVVGNHPEIEENELRQGPQELPALPVTVNGRLRRIEEVDRYRLIPAQSGLVTCQLMARRLGSDFHGVIEVRDMQNNLMADSVDTEGIDPALTFFAEKGKACFISVRDIDYRGYRNFCYRLTLTSGPRILAAIPSVGQRGKKSQVEFLGIGVATGQAKLESITRDVEFSTDKELQSINYRLETSFGVTPEFPLQLSEIPQHKKPASTDPKDRRFTVPCGLTARFTGGKDTETYIFTGKKGEFWDISAHACNAGSPWEVNTTVFGPDGKQLTLNDNSVALTTDGDYRVTVASGSGKHPTLCPVYHLEVKRATPQFQLRTSGIINIPVGGKANMAIAVLRTGGFKEPITLSCNGLPPGVSLPKDLVIAPTVNAFSLTVECSKDVAASTGLVQVTGSAKLEGKTITQTLLADYYGDLTPRHAGVNLMPHVLMATTMKPPFKLKVAEADGGRRIPRGSTHLSEILIERTDGFNGPIILDMAGNQQRHRQGIRGPALTVPPGVTKIDYPVFLPEWLETSRTSRIGLVAMALVEDQKGAFRYLMTPVEGQITMSIEGAMMKLSHAAGNITAVTGEPIELPLKLFRSKLLSEAVIVELFVPEELKGLVNAKPLAWSNDKDTENWIIKTQKDARLIGIRQFTARATTTYNGHPVISECTIEIEFIGPLPKR